MKKYINKILCFGTSFTAGGGFEFHLNNNLKQYYSKYNEELTRENFSWPGRLQKLNPNINIINYGKCGYGNERLYRIAFDEISKSNNENTLFIFEFSHLGRKEYYHNDSKEYFITNYHWKNSDGGDTHTCSQISIDEKVNIHGITHDCHYNNSKIDDNISRDYSIIKEFNEKTINCENQLTELSINILTFLSFCENNNINYLISAAPPLMDNTFNSYQKFVDKEVEYNYSNLIKNTGDMVGFIINNKLTITDETSHFIEDYHGGMLANTLIAKSINNRIDSDYNINPKSKYI